MIDPQAHGPPAMVAAPLEIRLRDHRVPAAPDHALDDLGLRPGGDVHQHERLEGVVRVQEAGEDEGDAGAREGGKVVGVRVVVAGGGHLDAGGGGGAQYGRGGVRGGEVGGCKE